MSWPMVRTKTPPGLPTREQIIDFIQTSDTPAGKREIARAFGLSAQQKISLKALLKDMADEGLIDSAPGRAFHKMGGLPKVTVLRVADVDDGGNVWAVPERWEAETPPPRVRVRERGRRSALGIGDRILARTEEAGNGWAAYPMKKLDRAAEAVLGVLRAEGDKLWLQGVDKKERREVPVSDAGGAAPGDLVLAAMAGRPPRITARVVERLGDPFEARSFSLIAIHKHGIPDVFSEEVLAEARKVAGYPIRSSPPREAGRISGREDLRHLPIVAIDPIDARDHDDAVWAKADDSEDNAGGWQAIVAIADVSFYVRPGSELDKSARSRGNSVYFPDRVVPMLPEALSNGWCSLRPDEDRGCLFVRMRFDAEGRKQSHRFGRGLMRSTARLTYEAVQSAHDAGEARFDGLYGAYRALLGAREKRGTLDLDLPERKVELSPEGKVLAVRPRERLDSHRLIEEFMVAANVCAAEELERLHQPCMYRIHDRPSDAKLEGLRQFLDTFGLSLPPGNELRPRDFAQLLERVKDRPEERLVHETVLRAQSQAEYAPENIGHFGLALARYAHFTSPIRRYADLLVHRALIAGLRLGPDGLTSEEAQGLTGIGEDITRTERRAAQAERDAVDRYLAAYMADHVGASFMARVSGVTRFGLFVTLDTNGASGIVPIRVLPDDRWEYEEGAQRLVGRHTGLAFSLGQPVEVRLAEAMPLTGSLTFDLLQGDPRAGRKAGGRSPAGGKARSAASSRRR